MPLTAQGRVRHLAGCGSARLPSCFCRCPRSCRQQLWLHQACTSLHSKNKLANRMHSKWPRGTAHPMTATRTSRGIPPVARLRTRTSAVAPPAKEAPSQVGSASQQAAASRADFCTVTGLGAGPLPQHGDIRLLRQHLRRQVGQHALQLLLAQAVRSPTCANGQDHFAHSSNLRARAKPSMALCKGQGPGGLTGVGVPLLAAQ